MYVLSEVLAGAFLGGGDVAAYKGSYHVKMIQG